ncbi:sortase domain-bontaining protein, partial [Cellulomonas endophytica]|uniref:sortase domain-containing protein n=1 Tax=Cellulomonas endophytica TaxID=2494735 RepID=UPI0013E92AE4
WQRAGWYREGVVPGDVGPAVVAGHVDSSDGPAVFVGLERLAPGDPVVVTLSDGSTRTFLVDDALRAPKAEFPTSEVYRTTPTPQLRLITCDGDFDRTTGHYVDNLVVRATLAP